MKTKKTFKMNLILFLIFNLMIYVTAKKKSQIIILGGGSSPAPMPYIHTSQGSSPQIIPLPIPIFLPMQQQSMMPPIYLPIQSPVSSTSNLASPHPTTQHIYHHHQNSSPQVHFIQLPVFKRERYIQQPEYATSSSGHYQSSEQYPVYSDYSYDYSPSSNIHRRNGLEFESFVPVHHFLGNQNYLNRHRLEKVKMTKRRKPKIDYSSMNKKKFKNYSEKSYTDNYTDKKYLDNNYSNKDYLEKNYSDEYDLMGKHQSVKYDLDKNRDTMIKK